MEHELRYDLIAPLSSTPQPSRYRFALNFEEYGPVLIGFGSFALIALCQWLDLPIENVPSWTKVDDVMRHSLYAMIFSPILICMLMFCIHCLRSDKKTKATWKYIFLCFVVFLCKWIGKQRDIQLYGFGDSFWDILIGSIIGNVLNACNIHFASNIYSLEFFIKIGIVLFAINANEFQEIGAEGLLVSWIETSVLLISLFYISYRGYKMDFASSLVTCCGLSICGSSAVMAISSTINAPIEMSQYLITIMSIFTVPLIPILPMLGLTCELQDNTIGAWIGGSIDSTGAVIASASLASPSHPHILRTAMVIKMLQNILIGPITLIITIMYHKSFQPAILWQKFPKFVLGFGIVCVMTTLLKKVDFDVTTNCLIVSEWFSSVGFVLIGMDINLFTLRKNIFSYQSVLILYVVGQLIDTFATTIIVAIFVYE